MLKTLRIASILTIIAAAVVVGAVGIFGLRHNPDIQAFLHREGIIEQFRKKIQNVPTKTDTVSPLELAAKAFALRIDPPPPPPPPPEKNPPKKEPVKSPPVVVPPKNPVVEKGPSLTPKFSLVATARYPSRPQKSMALLKSLQNEYTWYRQGEKVGHLDIQEIKDGSVVLYQNGQFNSEIQMPAPPKIKSLLKSDQQEDPAPRGPAAVTAAPADAPDQDVVVTTNASPGTPPPVRRSIPSRLPAVSSEERRPAASAATVRTSSRPVRSVPPQTTQEHKQSIDTSISSIEEIMNRTPAEGMSQEERNQEQEAWKQLLDVLQQERENLDQKQEGSGESAEPAEDQEKPQPESSNSEKVQ